MDDCKYRYTFEDDVDFSTKITAAVGGYDLVHQATEGFGLSTVAAVKVADGDGYIAQMTVAVGQAAFYGNPDVSDGIGESDSFSILAKIKASSAPNDNQISLRIWTYYDATGTAPEVIDFGLTYEDGAVRLKCDLADVNSNHIEIKPDISSLFLADTYAWVAIVLNRADGTLTLSWDKINTASVDASSIGEITVGGDAVVPMQGFYSVGQGVENQPVFTIADLRFFDRAISGDELIGEFDDGGGDQGGEISVNHFKFDRRGVFSGGAFNGCGLFHAHN